MQPKIKITLIAIVGFSCLIGTLMFFDRYKEKKKCKDLVELIEVFTYGCKLYYFDLREYPREHFDAHHSNFLARNLTMNSAHYEIDTSAMLSWGGPYIENRFLRRAYSYPGRIRIENFIEPENGFDLDADRALEVRGAGNYVTFSNASLELAKGIDEKIDKRISDEHWQITGRVKYSLKNNIISVFLTGGKAPRIEFSY